MKQRSFLTCFKRYDAGLKRNPPCHWLTDKINLKKFTKSWWVFKIIRIVLKFYMVLIQTKGGCRISPRGGGGGGSLEIGCRPWMLRQPEKGRSGGGGGGEGGTLTPFFFFSFLKKKCQFSIHWVRVSPYMTHLSDKQASKQASTPKKKKNIQGGGGGGGWTPITPPPPTYAPDSKTNTKWNNLKNWIHRI